MTRDKVDVVVYPSLVELLRPRQADILSAIRRLPLQCWLDYAAGRILQSRCVLARALNPRAAFTLSHFPIERLSRRDSLWLPS